MARRYSHSALRSYRACPRQYKFRYVDRVQVPRRLSADTHLGNVVHRVLRLLYKCGADGVVLDKDKMLASYDDAWSSTDLNAVIVQSDHYAIDDYYRLGREMLEQHHERYQPFKPGILLGTEMHTSFTLPGTDIKLRAVIDRLTRREDGTVEICDYKTGQRIPQPRDADFYYQMGIYQLAVQESFPDMQSVEVMQHMLRPDEAVRYRFSEDELDRLTEEIRVVVFETMRARRMDDFPATEGAHCRYCDYYELCPAKRHKLMLEQQEDEEEHGEVKSVGQQATELADRYLDVYQQEKALQAEKDALREDILRFVKDNDLSVLEGKDGDVKIKLGKKEKFVTKSKDPEGFLKLNMLVRDLNLDEFMVVDTTALMNDAVSKKRLAPDVLDRLREFIVEEDNSRINVKLSRPDDDEGE